MAAFGRTKISVLRTASHSTWPYLHQISTRELRRSCPIPLTGTRGDSSCRALAGGTSLGSPSTARRKTLDGLFGARQPDGADSARNTRQFRGHSNLSTSPGPLATAHEKDSCRQQGSVWTSSLVKLLVECGHLMDNQPIGFGRYAPRKNLKPGCPQTGARDTTLER
jgi:hypothetical protein